MVVYQLLATISFGDAVSNDTLALQEIIKKMGYKTAIFAENIDSRIPKGTAKNYSKFGRVDKNDIIIYHLSTGSKISRDFDKFKCRKVIIYHNITPPEFFEGYNDASYRICKKGYEEVRALADKVDYCIAVSEYNKQNLRDMGFKCPIDVLPILIPFEDYEKKPNEAVIAKYGGDGWTNLLFTGRIAPNKKQEDVIRAFAFYKKYYNPNSRLFLVGSSGGMERYHRRLVSYINALGVRDVIFPGHIKFDEILAYYSLADVFVCQSEHEGFCVPLVEAMKFDVPIVAYDSSAIADTLGGSGILMKEKDPVLTAGVINRLVTDKALREKVISNQRIRLADFDNEKIGGRFEKLFADFIDKGRK
ncbi:MAG: glycosyltransferase family 4 protein [Clostridia bacterium]|nr:glycosyltransferase family 4 protein [Clostridia bacterium]